MFMAMPMLYRVAAVLIALAVVAGGWMLYLRERNNFAEYRAATIAAAKAQQEKTDLITKQQNRITKKAEESHAQNVASIRSVYDGLRRSNGSSTLPTVPDTAKDPAGATAYYVSVAPDLAIKCAETTQQWVGLRDWVIEQQKVNE